MNFDRINKNLSDKTVEDARRVFTRLLIELGVRETNYHVGTGLGGNNFQLFSLMAIPQSLGYTKKQIAIHKDHVEWNAEWLVATPMTVIRHTLDGVFPSIRERFKYEALLVDAVANNPSTIRLAFAARQDHFPILSNILGSKHYSFDKNLSMLEQFSLAMVMCSELAQQVDNNDTSMIPVIGKVLVEMDPEIILIAVRKCIAIERLVKFNMDEDPYFGRALTQVNNLIN